MRIPRSIVVLTAAVLLPACGAADDEAQLAPPDETATDDDGPVTPTVPDVVDGAGDDGTGDDGAGDDVERDLDASVNDAVADLAAATGVDAAQIEVRTAEQVTWSDGSLGCPEPGMMYTQALVPGYRIVLAVDGTEVAYHGAEGAAPARCDDPRPPSDTGT